MNKFLTLLEGAVIGGALVIIADHINKDWYRHTNRIYRPTTYVPYYKRYTEWKDDKEEE